MRKHLSRGERFVSGAETLLKALNELRNAWDSHIDAVNDALEELVAIKEEYDDWSSNLPENLHSSELGMKLDAIAGITLDNLVEPDFDSLETAAEDCLNAEIPLGFGRD
jgi:hypothetical protein